MDNLKLLIISPHSYCNKEIERRHCDRRAKEEAEKLNDIATNAGYDVTLILSDTLRKIHDYNRKESFNTPWRNKVRDFLEKNKMHPIIIYEVHSYPPKGTEFEDGSQIALLAIDEYYPNTKILHDYIDQHTNVIIHPKINETRINNLMIDTSQYDNIKQHYLLEFNEDKKILTDKQSDHALFNIFLVSLFPNCVKICNMIINYWMMILIIFILIYVIYMTPERGFANEPSLNPIGVQSS